MNLTNIIFIPKVQNPTKMAKFKPINLCNVIYKIISKTLTSRLQKFLPKCINSSLNAFAPGKLISNNVLLAYKLFHTGQN